MDDGSPEPVREAFKRFDLSPEFPKKTTIVRNETPKGFPLACHIGAARAEGKFLVFMNSDIIPLPGWWDHMQRAFEHVAFRGLGESLQPSPPIGIVGAKLLFPPDTEGDPMRPAGKIQHAGLTFPPSNQPYHRFIGWTAENPRANKFTFLQAVTGALMGVRTDLWKKLGGFWEGFGKGTYEDVDFCLRARQAGYRVAYDPEIVAYHYTGASGQPFPLSENFHLFLTRHRGKVVWDEWDLL